MLAFETFIHPLDPHHVSEGRGGGTRLRGEYGDSMSYAVYFIGTFLIYSYFYLDKVFAERKKVKVPTGKLLLIFLLCLYGIINIRHVSTWSVFVVILSLFVFFNSKNVKGVMVVFFVGLIILPFFARQIYESQIRPLIEKEFAVMTGEKDVEYAFNGRVQRWERYFDIWDKMPGFARFFGVSFSGFKEVPTMIGGGMHNDYIRITFLSGIFGVCLYVLFIISVFFQRNRFRPPERYLILSACGATLLYSMSTLPSLYLALMNYTFPIFAFAMLPRRAAYGLGSRTVPPLGSPKISDAA
jgi:O-antigen ligase